MTVKCGWLKCKIDYRFILPSNYFQKKISTEPREREKEAGHRHREREREEKAGHCHRERE